MKRLMRAAVPVLVLAGSALFLYGVAKDAGIDSIRAQIASADRGLLLVAALANRVKNLHIPADVIAGTATAAIGWAALVADRLHLPFVYVRSKPKEHGAKKLIEGDLKPEKHVVVIEDLISTAKSSVASVDALRSEGKCYVTDVVSIFSYEMQSAMEKAREAKVRLHPLATITDLVDIAVADGNITKEEAAIIAEFSKNPEQWSVSRG